MYDKTMVRRTAAEAAQTRCELMDAALEVFDECGFAGTTLQAISGRAGVTRGALYHHFASKAEIYDAVLRQEADQVMRPLMDGLTGEGPPLRRIHQFLVSYCIALERDVGFRRVIGLLLGGATGAPRTSRDRTASGYAGFVELFEAVLREARDRRDLRDGVSPHGAARSVLAVAVGATTASLQVPELFSPAREAGALADVLIAGLTA